MINNNTNFTIQKATKKKQKARIAIYGPSGSGKTMTSLRIANGIAAQMNNKILLVDTERGSGSLYSDRFDFDTIDLKVSTIDNLISILETVTNYDVIIIDSMSHSWQELLEHIDRLAKTKFSGNTWAAWSEGTPQQRKFIDALLSSPSHVIATMRTKTEWQPGKDDKGKFKVEKVGLAPEQGKGIEYEFSILMEITTDHIATITKDRSGKFQDQIIESPGEDMGVKIYDWLNSGLPSDFYERIDILATYSKTTREIVISKMEAKYGKIVRNFSEEEAQEALDSINKSISNAEKERDEKRAAEELRLSSFVELTSKYAEAMNLGSLEAAQSVIEGCNLPWSGDYSVDIKRIPLPLFNLWKKTMEEAVINHSKSE